MRLLKKGKVRKSCEEKRKFSTYSKAMRYAKLVWLRHKSNQQAFMCPKCGAFHLTKVRW